MADYEPMSMLRQQLEKAKENLSNVDGNIRKLTGREPGERRSVGDSRRVSDGGGSRSRGPGGQRQDAFQRLGPSPAKRANLGSAFSRLGGRVGGSERRPMRRGRRGDSDEEDSLSKPTIQSSVVAAPQSLRTRKDSIEEQNKDTEGKRRNRRMFGLLLGTLQQFKADSSTTTEKDKRRDEIEKKLEEKAVEEKEALANERKFLFLERRAKQAKLEELEQLMELANEQDAWDKHAKNLGCFIRTKAKPHIFYRPKRATQTSDKRHDESRELILDQMHKRRIEIEEDIKKAGADEEEELKEDRKRKRSGEERTKEGKEGDKGKTKERRRHSEGRGREDEDSHDRKRNGLEEDDRKDRDRRDDGRKRRRSERSGREERGGSREAGDGTKESSKESGRDRRRSRTRSGDKKDKKTDDEDDKIEEAYNKTKDDGKKAEQEEKEEGEVMDEDEQSQSKPTESTDDKTGAEEMGESEQQVGEVSSSNDDKDKDAADTKDVEMKDDKEEDDDDDDDSKHAKAEKEEEQVPMEEGETRDDEDEKQLQDDL